MLCIVSYLAWLPLRGSKTSKSKSMGSQRDTMPGLEGRLILLAPWFPTIRERVSDGLFHALLPATNRFFFFWVALLKCLLIRLLHRLRGTSMRQVNTLDLLTRVCNASYRAPWPRFKAKVRAYDTRFSIHMGVYTFCGDRAIAY